jgi:hypothetical protein
MMMRAIQQNPLGIDQPFFCRFTPALRTGAVFAGVVPNAGKVAIFTILRMTTKLFRTTGRQLAQGLMLRKGDFIALEKTLKVLIQNPLNCMLIHISSVQHKTVFAYSSDFNSSPSLLGEFNALIYDRLPDLKIQRSIGYVSDTAAHLCLSRAYHQFVKFPHQILWAFGMNLAP